jgi:O-antigen ligase
MVINLKKYWAVILILLTIVGFVSKALYNYPLTIMAIIGFYKVIISPRSVWNDQTLKYFIFLFLCLWIPMLLAFPDAVNPSRSAQTVFPYLRFLFAGIFIIHELSKNDECFKIFIYGVFFIVTFWCIDASIQFFIGYNLLGFPYRAGEITGMFYPRNTIAHICAILSPICFYTVFKHSERKKWFWLGIVPLFFVVLISGRRAAWVMLALCSFGFVIFLYLSSVNKNKMLRQIIVISCIIGAILTSTIILNQATRDRFQTTLGLFSFDYKSINAATAVRLPIWEVAYSIFKERPINGIGPRGFRFIYHDYAKTDDIWIQSSSNRLSYLFSENLPPTHPHLLLLEILVETGIIGLVGFLLLFYFLIKSRRKIKNISYEFVFLIPVFVSLFPFNSHMAFYGSVWSSMIWLLMAVYFSSLRLALSRHTI